MRRDKTKRQNDREYTGSTRTMACRGEKGKIKFSYKYRQHESESAGFESVGSLWVALCFNSQPKRRRHLFKQQGGI